MVRSQIRDPFAASSLGVPAQEAVAVPGGARDNFRIPAGIIALNLNCAGGLLHLGIEKHIVIACGNGGGVDAVQVNIRFNQSAIDQIL